MTGVPGHVLPGGAAWSVQVARDRSIKFTAVHDRANVSLLMFVAGSRVDRLNIPDTLKSQYSACVKAPMVLMSDRGVGLASVTGSSLAWHDALCGHGLGGIGSYDADRNGWQRGARAGLLSELRKHGRSESDLHATVNLFSKVELDTDAKLSYVNDHARAGDWVTLRSEVELLLVLSSAPHPLDPTWAPADVTIDIEVTSPAGPEDPSRTFRAESARALDQSAKVLA